MVDAECLDSSQAVDLLQNMFLEYTGMAPAPFVNPQFRNSPSRTKCIRMPVLTGEAPFGEVQIALARHGILTHNKTLHQILKELHQCLKEHYKACQCQTKSFVHGLTLQQQCTELLALIRHTKKLIRWVYKDQPERMPYKLTLELYRTPTGSKSRKL